ncbi:hypothetical protein EDD22DRAFT_855328 [Suillus occidentalis]|nr:hypothetical protein EDD22DRAFT_855328 [Suillus occidentalis]
MDLIDELKSHNCIFGKLPTVKELLDCVEKREVGGHDYKFPGGDKDIVKEVQRQMAIERGDIIEVDLDSEEHKKDEKMTLKYTFTEVIALSQQLEEACLQFELVVTRTQTWYNSMSGRCPTKFTLHLIASI